MRLWRSWRKPGWGACEFRVRNGGRARAGRVGSPHGRWRPTIAPPTRTGGARATGRGDAHAMGRGASEEAGVMAVGRDVPIAPPG